MRPPARISSILRVPPVVHVPSSWVFPTLGPELFEALRSRGHRRIALQVPAGLVRNAHELAQRMWEETGASVSLVARACFGACDFPSEGEVPGADALVVLGHSPIPNVRLTMPTYFVEMRQEGGEPGALAKTLVAAGVPARLGLVASVQHLDLLPRLTLALQAHGITLQTGTGGHRLSYPSQALGCNYTSAQSISATVDAYLFVGTGRFHPVGLAYAVGKPVWSLDPLQNRLEPPIDRASLVRDRQLLVARAMDARTFGIIVSSFSGQNRSAMAAALVDRARRAGRSAEIIVADRRRSPRPRRTQPGRLRLHRLPSDRARRLPALPEADADPAGVPHGPRGVAPGTLPVRHLPLKRASPPQGEPSAGPGMVEPYRPDRAARTAR